jgi:hypothetical protein
LNLKLALPPPAIAPVSKTGGLAVDVDVCVEVSLFIHVTVVPTDTVSGFGENADDPSDLAPAGMVTVAVDGGGVGVGVGVGEGGGGELLPHPERHTNTKRLVLKRRNMFAELLSRAE